MTSNKYLVQALRAYRQKTYGQFDQVSESVVQETQDAAAEIERLNKQVEDLTLRKIPIGVTHPVTSGNYKRWDWQQVAEALGESENAASDIFNFSPYTLVIGADGIEAYGSIRSKGS